MCQQYGVFLRTRLSYMDSIEVHRLNLPQQITSASNSNTPPSTIINFHAEIVTASPTYLHATSQMYHPENPVEVPMIIL